MHMNNFNVNVQVEEVGTYLTVIANLMYKEWFDGWCKECEDNFFKALMSLLEYKQQTNYTLYLGAVKDAYENASADMMEYMRMIDINNDNELLIYLNGFERGLKG